MSIVQNGKISIANLGDSCGFIISKKGIMRKITVDHTPNRVDERERIINNNGFITNKGGVCRVDGEIAVSRAIGDKNLKQYLISEPEVFSCQITDEDDLLILSTDGIFLVYKE
jgi:protein phosphatase 1L